MPLLAEKQCLREIPGKKVVSMPRKSQPPRQRDQSGLVCAWQKGTQRQDRTGACSSAQAATDGEQPPARTCVRQQWTSWGLEGTGQSLPRLTESPSCLKIWQGADKMGCSRLLHQTLSQSWMWRRSKEEARRVRWSQEDEGAGQGRCAKPCYTLFLSGGCFLKWVNRIPGGADFQVSVAFWIATADTLSLIWVVELQYGRRDAHPRLVGTCGSWEVAPHLAAGLLGGLVQVVLLLIDCLGTVSCSLAPLIPLYFRGCDTLNDLPKAPDHFSKKATTWTGFPAEHLICCGSTCLRHCKCPSTYPVSELAWKSFAFANKVSCPPEQSGCMPKASWEWSLDHSYSQTMPAIGLYQCYLAHIKTLAGSIAPCAPWQLSWRTEICKGQKLSPKQLVHWFNFPRFLAGVYYLPLKCETGPYG